MNGPELKPQELRQLWEYRDGELTADEARRVERRVASDPAWGRAYRRIEAFDGLLDAWQPPPPARDLPRRILAAAGFARSRQTLRLAARWLGPAAAAAAVVLALTFWGPHFGGDPAARQPVRPVARTLPPPAGGTAEPAAGVSAAENDDEGRPASTARRETGDLLPELYPLDRSILESLPLLRDRERLEEMKTVEAGPEAAEIAAPAAEPNDRLLREDSAEGLAEGEAGAPPTHETAN
jgi:hypothetical protein